MTQTKARLENDSTIKRHYCSYKNELQLEMELYMYFELRTCEL